jgi:hypothetical protein
LRSSIGSNRLALCALILSSTAGAGAPADARNGVPGQAPARASAHPSSPPPKPAPTPPDAQAPPASDGAASEEIGRQRSAARATLVKGLLELASWCNSKELYLERDHVYTSILELDPDNLEARKGLRYARNPDGSWKDPAPREMKNRNPKALDDLPAKRAEAIAPYRDRLLDILESTHADAAERKSVFDEILALDPDDARVHKILDEVKLDGKWMMPESANGKKRRPEIKGLVKKSLEGAPAVVKEASVPDEVKLGGAWTTMVHAGGVRVLGTVSAEECGRIARTCAAIGPFMDALFDCKATYPEGYTFYVFGSPGEKNAFVEKLPEVMPDLKPEARDYMSSIASVGLASSNNVLLGDADPVKRLDGAVRHTIIHLLRNTYGIDDRHGWIWEGMGLYLTRELIGTRYTWFVSVVSDPDQDAQRVALLTPASNWMNEAVKLLDGPKPPNLAFTAGRELSQMHVEDMLSAYALASYFLEGRPQETPDLLRRIGNGDSTATVVQALFKSSMEELQERVTRWLKERR